MILDLSRILLTTYQTSIRPLLSCLFTEKGIDLRTSARPNVSVINLPSHRVGDPAKASGRHSAAQTTSLQDYGRILSDGSKRTLILTQNDPDPDAIASGMAAAGACRRESVDPGYFGRGHPQRKHCHAQASLKVDLKRITKKEIRKYDRVVLVDVQPSRFPKGALHQDRRHYRSSPTR